MITDNYPHLRRTRLEICADTIEAALAADKSGADRIEVCTNLSVGGLTPPAELVRGILASVSIPVHVLVRPRAGTFHYSTPEFELIQQEVALAKAMGAAGVVVGILNPDLRIDIERTRTLVELAQPLQVTFHRAFDETADDCQALEDVISTGSNALLTSGRAVDVHAGTQTLAALVRQANGRIAIMAGGGLTLGRLQELVTDTGIAWVHGTLSREVTGSFTMEDAINTALLTLSSIP